MKDRFFFPLMKEQIWYHKEGSIQIKESETTKSYRRTRKNLKQQRICTQFSIFTNLEIGKIEGLVIRKEKSSDLSLRFGMCVSVEIGRQNSIGWKEREEDTREKKPTFWPVQAVGSTKKWKNWGLRCGARFWDIGAKQFFFSFGFWVR